VIDLADTFTTSIEVWTAPPELGGALTNAGTVVLTITLPDQTTTTPTVTNSSTGKYKYDLLTTQAGRHLFRWVTTSPATAHTEEVNVSPADPRFVISLAVAKKHLNITSTTDDEEIRSWLAAVTEVIENKVGPVVVRTVTDERHDGNGRSLWLRNTPAISLTTVLPWLTSGTTYAAADLRLSPESGRVERKDGLPFTGGPFAVTYRAGRAIIGENISQAAAVILKHLWETQRGPQLPSLQGQDDTTLIPGMGFAVPNRALELLAPDELVGNFA
jgi:hypothetical protein